MGFINSTHLQQFSGVLRWLDDQGNLVKSTTLSDISVNNFCWDAAGDYFYTSSNSSTGFQEKWARGGSTYTWRRTGIDNIVGMAVNSNGDLIVARQDDVYLLGASDGATDYSDVGSSMQYYTASIVLVDSSDNIYVFGSDYYYYTNGLKCFVFNSTLTYQSSWQVHTGSYPCEVARFDSSGNYFIVYSSSLVKYNSSGTVQWTYHPHPSGNGYGNVRDIRIDSDGLIYGCHYGNGSYIFCLTDNGGSYTEEWNIDHSTNGSTAKITLTDDKIICFATNMFALDKTDGSLDTNFTSYTLSASILYANNDPLMSATSGPLTSAYSLNYDRWVYTEGTFIIGPHQTTDQNTLRGYGDKLIDKLYMKGNYRTTSSRDYNFSMVGEQPSEEWWVEGYANQLYTYDGIADKDYNFYIPVYYASLTAPQREERSDGYYTTSGAGWWINKYDKDGTFIYSSKLVIGTLYDICFDSSCEFIYVRQSWTSGRIMRLNASDGSYADDGDYYFIQPTTDSGDSIRDGTFKIGRDDKLYFVLYDYGLGYDVLYKYDLDGTASTGWSTPLHVEGVNEPTDPWRVKFLDVNTSGEIVLAGTSDRSSDTPIKIYNASQTLIWEYFTPSSEMGSRYALINEDTEVICDCYDTGSYRTRKIPPNGTKYSYTYDYNLAAVSSTGQNYFIAPFWSKEGDQDYFYTTMGNVTQGSRAWKYDSSDGSVVWYYPGDDDTWISWGGIAAIQVPSWAITVTFGSNGVVKTYWGGSDDGGHELTSGDVIYAEALRDYRFAFVGDAGFFVDEVTIDGTSIGFASSYTFTNISYRHTIHVTFGTGFPSGPFVVTNTLKGIPTTVKNIGALSETFALRAPGINWVFGNLTLSETLSITGEPIIDFAYLLLMYINNRRSDNTLPAYEVHEWLVDGAEYAVADMVANGSLTLTLAQIIGQDGANYPYIEAAAVPTIADEVFTAQDIFDSWILNSTVDGYILDDNMDDIGIYVENYNGDNYIFVLFAQWHPQYIAHRMPENIPIELSLPIAYHFAFLSSENHALFLENSRSIFLPTYAAKTGLYEIPDLLSFTYRLELGTPSYLSVHAKFTNEVFEQIETNKDEGIAIESIIRYAGSEIRNEVINVDSTEINVIAGESPKIEISGYKELRYYESTIALQNVITRVKDEKGKTRFRCSQPDFYIRPGCTVTYGSHTIIVEKVVIFVNSGVNQYMELTGE